MTSIIPRMRQNGVGVTGLWRGVHLRFKDEDHFICHEKRRLMDELRKSEWKFNPQRRTAYHKMDIQELNETLTIMRLATSAKGFEKPHSAFKKTIKNSTSLGIAGPGNLYWKEKGTFGLLAHRMYDQLFKHHKKNK